MARLTLPALITTAVLAFAPAADARKYDRAIQSRQHAYDVARGEHAHASTSAERRHARFEMRKALRGKRYWQRRQAAHERSLRPYFVLPWRVVQCESAGNWHAVNPNNPARPAGAYQIITATWLAYGGGRFAPTADRASWREQNTIALRVLAGQGPRAWECWT